VNAPDLPGLFRRLLRAGRGQGDELRGNEPEDDARGERDVHMEEELDGEAEEGAQDHDRDPFQGLEGSEHAWIVG